MSCGAAGSTSSVLMRGMHAALRMPRHNNDQNDAEGLTEIMRIGWYRAVHINWLATRHLVNAWCSSAARGDSDQTTSVACSRPWAGCPVAGVVSGLIDMPKPRLDDWPDVALIVRPMPTAWRPLRKQVAAFDQAMVRQTPSSELLMRAPKHGTPTASSNAFEILATPAKSRPLRRPLHDPRPSQFLIRQAREPSGIRRARALRSGPYRGTLAPVAPLRLAPGSRPGMTNRAKPIQPRPQV